MSPRRTTRTTALTRTRKFAESLRTINRRNWTIPRLSNLRVMISQNWAQLHKDAASIILSKSRLSEASGSPLTWPTKLGRGLLSKVSSWFTKNNWTKMIINPGEWWPSRQRASSGESASRQTSLQATWHRRTALATQTTKSRTIQTKLPSLSWKIFKPTKRQPRSWAQTIESRK